MGTKKKNVKGISFRQKRPGQGLTRESQSVETQTYLTREPFLTKEGLMKQLTCLTITACATLSLAITAFGGPEPMPSGKEMKQVAPAPPECDYTWTGFYLGGNGGYGWGSADTRFEPLPDAVTFGDLEPTTLRSVDPSGFIGGGQIGFNWQWNKWLVLGVEADFQGSDMEGSQTSSPIIDIGGASEGADTFLRAHERTQWFGTARARIGFVPMCRLMIYATGGLAYGNIDYSSDTDFGNGTTYSSKFSTTKAGWTVGGGLEWALTHHWSLKAEYLYYDLGSESKTLPQLFDDVPSGNIFFVRNKFDTTANIVRGGVNFKF
jgi:outer membrane immunogenic protein